MDIILDMTKTICILFVFVYYRLMLHGIIFFIFFVSGNFIGILFGEMATVTSILDEISLLFSKMDNAILHASGHSPTDKIE